LERANIPVGERNVLYHADNTERHGVASESFLENFPRRTWVSLHNLLGKHQVRRYEVQAHLVNILADYGAAAWIKIHLERANISLAKAKGGYDSTLIAALYASNHNAARALCDMDPLEDSRPPGVH
jgi:hypothetical protein